MEYELVFTLAVITLALASLANQVYAQRVPCNLTVRSDPSSGSIHFGESIGAKISGKLTCSTPEEMKGVHINHNINGVQYYNVDTHSFVSPRFFGVGGATIDLTGLSHSVKAITDSSGNYHADILVGPQIYAVKANYAGGCPHPDCHTLHNGAYATTTMHFTVK